MAERGRYLWCATLPTINDEVIPWGLDTLPLLTWRRLQLVSWSLRSDQGSGKAAGSMRGDLARTVPTVLGLPAAVSGVHPVAPVMYGSSPGSDQGLFV